MSVQENIIFNPTDAEVEAVNVPSTNTIKLQQSQWIDFKAVGGLLTDDDGHVTKMTCIAFAEKLGVTYNTLYTWTKTIPGFWKLVEQRRAELARGNTATNIFNALRLQAQKGDMAAIKFYYEAYLDYQPPSQKHEVLIGGLADLAKLAEKKQIIEGETV